MIRILLPLALLAAPAEAASLTVAANTIERGAIVSASDLTSADVAEDTRTALAERDIVGRQATRRIDAGRTIRASDVREPLMVERSSAVTLVVQTGNLTITSSGRAFQGGQKGEVIRVQPLGSTAFIEGEVIGPGRVRIASGGQPLQVAAR